MNTFSKSKHKEINPIFHDYKLEEYISLRNEIARNQDFIDKLVFSSVALNFAIYSFVLQGGYKITTAIFSMFPLFICSFSNYWLHLKIRTGLRVVKYIREKLESPDAAYYENRLLIFRKNSQTKKIEFETIDNPKEKRKVQKTIFVYIFNFFFFFSPVVSIWILFNIEDRKLFIPKLFDLIICKIFYSCLLLLFSIVMYNIQNIFIERINKQIRFESGIKFDK